MWVPKLQMRIDDSSKTLDEFPLPRECSQSSSSSAINDKDTCVNQSALCAHTYAAHRMWLIQKDQEAMSGWLLAPRCCWKILIDVVYCRQESESSFPEKGH